MVSTTIVVPVLGCTRDIASRITFRSSVAQGHEHLLTVNEDVFFAPPQTGLTRRTTVVRDHEHIVILGQEQLRRIGEGEVITRATSAEEGHVHIFEFFLFDDPPLTTTGTTTGTTSPVEPATTATSYDAS
jgi:hypothetical protein